MTENEVARLEVVLKALEAIDAEMRDLHGGVAAIHVEAAAVALASHLRRHETICRLREHAF